MLDDTCGQCQNFINCQFLFQCAPDSRECDFTPSRFLRKGAGREKHFSRCGVFDGLLCDCSAIIDGKKPLREVLIITAAGETLVITP
jgi:hypothetical protein